MRVTNKTSTKSPRLAFFDGYRGALILLILTYYFFQHILPGGFLAVNAFLMVAGFFAFRHFYTAPTLRKSVSIKSYLKSRLERIFFPTLFMVLLVAAYIALFAPDYFYNLRNMGFSSLFFVNNYYQILSNQSYFVQAANPSAFTHLWYISIYAQLILLTPFVVKVVYSWHRNPATAAIMLVALSIASAVLLGYLYQDGQDPSRIYYDLLTRAFAFTFGGALGYLFPVHLKPKAISKRQQQVFNGIGIASVILMTFMLLFMYGTQPFAYRFGMLLFTLLSMVFVIVSLHPSTWLHKFLSLPVFTFFGKRSLSYYLWFYPIHLVIPDRLNGFHNIWISVGVQFLLIMLMAEISYQLFERRRLILPFGQDFNWKQTQARVRYLVQHRASLWGIKTLAISYLLVSTIGLVALAITPEQKNKAADELATVIESNQKLVEETKEPEIQETKVINNIEGLNRQELLQANALEVTFIGDSILLASADKVKEVFPKAIVDGQIGRQLYQSNEVINSLKASGKLKGTVVTVLGSNGTFTDGQLNDYINAIGTDREQYFVTSSVDKVWVEDANNRLFAAANRYSNVKVIDWRTYAKGHDDWYYEDGIHPNPTGALEFAKFVANQIAQNR